MGRAPLWCGLVAAAWGIACAPGRTLDPCNGDADCRRTQVCVLGSCAPVDDADDAGRGVRGDAGAHGDGGASFDDDGGAALADGGAAPDGGAVLDDGGAALADGGAALADGGAAIDGGGGALDDAGTFSDDAGVVADGGPLPDGGAPADAGAPLDAGQPLDAGAPLDAGPGPPLFKDTFDRVDDAGWGDAYGAASPGPRSYAVDGDRGVLELQSAGAGGFTPIEGLLVRDIAVVVNVTTDKAPTGTGSGQSAYVSVRVGGGAHYTARLRFRTINDVALTIEKDQAGATIDLAPEVYLPDSAYAPGDAWLMRFEVAGVSPTVLRAKAWRATDAEPAAFDVEASDPGDVVDGGPELTAAGGVQVGGYISSSATNAPVRVSFDDLVVTALP